MRSAKNILRVLLSTMCLLPAAAIAKTPSLDAAGIARMRELGVAGVESKVCQGTGDLRVLPVGFSKKGAFAYILRTDEDAIVLWSFVVIDLVTDKRLLRITMEDPDNNVPLEQFLADKGKEIKKALAKHRIQDADTGKLGKWPLKHKDRKYLLFFMEQESNGKSKHYVNLVAKGKGQKQLAVLEAPGGDYCCKALGYYRSPFEERVAILVLKGSRGFEGAVVCDLVTIGSHLNVRFKSSKKK